MSRLLCSVVLCCGLALTPGCAEDEPEVPQVDPCLEFFDLDNPQGNWMYARGSSAAPQPDPAYRVQFFKRGDTQMAYYVHDLERLAHPPSGAMSFIAENARRASRTWS